MVSDETVERAAKALEKKCKQDTYEWSDELFDIWWNADPEFNVRVQVWPHFHGTQKQRCLYEARIILEEGTKMETTIDTAKDTVMANAIGVETLGNEIVLSLLTGHEGNETIAAFSVISLANAKNVRDAINEAIAELEVK